MSVLQIPARSTRTRASPEGGAGIGTYDRGAGIGFSDRDVENDFKMVLKAYDKLGGTNLAQVQPRDPDRALQLIETYLRYQLSGNPRAPPEAIGARLAELRAALGKSA